jgi:hypothetical protein
MSRPASAHSWPACLAGAGWEPGAIGIAMTLGGVVTVALQTPAGAVVYRVANAIVAVFVV